MEFWSFKNGVNASIVVENRPPGGNDTLHFSNYEYKPDILVLQRSNTPIQHSMELLRSGYTHVGSKSGEIYLGRCRVQDDD
jgi:hypothetical protein